MSISIARHHHCLVQQGPSLDWISLPTWHVHVDHVFVNGEEQGPLCPEASTAVRMAKHCHSPVHHPFRHELYYIELGVGEDLLQEKNITERQGEIEQCEVAYYARDCRRHLPALGTSSSTA